MPIGIRLKNVDLTRVIQSLEHHNGKKKPGGETKTYERKLTNMFCMDKMALEHSYILERTRGDNRNYTWDTLHAETQHGWRFTVAQLTNDSGALVSDYSLLLFLKRQ